MAKKEESDQALTSGEPSKEEKKVREVSSTPEQEHTQPKIRSGVFGLVTITAALVLGLVTLFGPFSSSGEFHVDESTDLTIKLSLSSDEFLIISSKNVCDGIGSIPGIKTGTAIVESKLLNIRVPIGSGQLNDKGECEYTITVPTSDEFKGGSVNFSFKFPFGKSLIFSENVGPSAPYKNANISISLD